MKKIFLAMSLVIQCALIGSLALGTMKELQLALAIAALAFLLGSLLLRGPKATVAGGRIDRVPGSKDVETPQPVQGGDPIPVAPVDKSYPTPGSGALPTPPVGMSAGYFDRYLAYLAEKLGEDASNRVKDDVESILGEQTSGRIDEVIARHDSRNRAKGLVCGRVQSGKTQNYTGLITRAVDDGWNTIIVLTSNNTALEVQTINRLRKDLAACGLTEERYVLIDNFLDSDLPSMREIENGKVYVGFALKQADHLRGRNGNGKGVIGWLSNCNESISGAKVIVIDDEADNATQNTVVGATDWSDDAVRQYVEGVYVEAERQHDEATLRVAEWLQSLIEKEDFSDIADDDKVGSLKKLLESRVDEEDVKAVVRDYAGLLGLDKKVAFGGRGADSAIAPQASGFVENYFTRRAAVGRRGHSRGDDFRGILRWVFNVRKERSVINKAICKLVSADTFPCAKLTYVGYTASPYANFLNEELGADNPLELDFSKSMSIAPEYFGLAKIFGKDVGSTLPRMPIIKSISNKERAEVTGPLMDDVDIGLDANLGYDYVDASGKTRRTGSWESMKNAIKWAIVAAAVRRGKRIVDGIAEFGEETRSDRWTTMLVNLSRKIDNHSGLRDAIDDYISSAKKDVRSFRNECLALFDGMCHDIDAAAFSRLFPEYPHTVSDPERRAVEEHLDYVLGHIRVMALNSDASNVQAYNEYVQNVPESKQLSGDWLWIVVGGNRISRGLTFDGLVSSYFDRDRVSVNVDTLLQMGRWFGYRVGYELLPRVWMPDATIRSMKEICALEEDLHTQLQESFERHEDRPNPKMIAISRRLTGRNGGEDTEPGVENPMIIREFFPRAVAEVDGVLLVSDFLAKCGRSETVHSVGMGKVYTRLDRWSDVRMEIVKPFFSALGRLFSRSELDRLNATLEMLEKTDSVDIVLSNPMNKKPAIALANGVTTRPHGISEYETLEDGSVRFGKFSGQYDSWKAVVPTEIVDSVESDYGVRANTNEAIMEMFTRMAAKGIETRPVVQIGFIEVNAEPVPYVSVLCPGRDWIKESRVTARSVLVPVTALGDAGNQNTTTTTTPVRNIADISKLFSDALMGKNYVPESCLSKRVKDYLKSVSKGGAAMPSGFGYWRETRSGYGTGAAVFRKEWAEDAHAFLVKIIDEASRAIAARVKGSPTEVFQARDLWRDVTQGKYNGILEPTGKHVIPQRLGDVEERVLLGFGVACVDNGFGRPKVKACTRE